MDGTEARYEWRVWATRLDDVFERIARVAEYEGDSRSTDTYVVSHAVADANPKLRARRLDVKVLCRIEAGFEQWDVACKVEFPIPAEMITGDVLPLLGVESPQLERTEYTAARLLDEVVATHPLLAVVEVEKHRRFYTFGDCMAETAEVVVDGRPQLTSAVESTDLDALRGVRRRLGLDRYPNVSYPRAIRRAIGWEDVTPRPRGTIHGA